MTSTDRYTGETVRGLTESAVYHVAWDMMLCIARHCLNSDHETINIENFKYEV